MAEVVEQLDFYSKTLPSLFELLNIASLDSTLEIALRYVISILSHRTERHGWVARYTDEIYALLQLILEHYFLNKYGATFSENFYGLKRAPRSSPKPGFYLTGTQRDLSLLCHVVWPYLRKKVEHLSEQVASLSPFSQSLLALFRKIEASYEVSRVAYLVLFALQYIPHSSPLLHYLGLQLSRVTRADEIVLQRDNLRASKTLQRDYQRSNLLLKILLTLQLKASSWLKSTLPLCLFILNFLEWWYATRGTVQGSRPIPPPPAPLPLNNPSDQTAKSIKKGICALCSERFENPTLLPQSGFVFCYRCIYDSLEEQGQCPLTRHPATVAQLVRLYINSSEI